MNEEQLEELLNPGTNTSGDYENPATDDMIANVNVPMMDSSDTNTDSIIPDNLETAEDIIGVVLRRNPNGYTIGTRAGIIRGTLARN